MLTFLLGCARYHNCDAVSYDVPYWLLLAAAMFVAFKVAEWFEG